MRETKGPGKGSGTKPGNGNNNSSCGQKGSGLMSSGRIGRWCGGSLFRIQMSSGWPELEVVVKTQVPLAVFESVY